MSAPTPEQFEVPPVNLVGLTPEQIEQLGSALDADVSASRQAEPLEADKFDSWYRAHRQKTQSFYAFEDALGDLADSDPDRAKAVATALLKSEQGRVAESAASMASRLLIAAMQRGIEENERTNVEAYHVPSITQWIAIAAHPQTYAAVGFEYESMLQITEALPTYAVADILAELVSTVALLSFELREAQQPRRRR